jgi:HK97 family phage major capsid protein
MATKRYNLARALLNADGLNCPEAEDHFRIRKADEDFRNKLTISGVNRRWKSGISVPFGGLLSRDLAVNPNTNAALTVSTVIPEIQASLRPTSIIARLPIQIVMADGLFVLPRLGTGTAASPLSEVQVLSSSDASFSATGAGPARLSVQTKFSKQLLAQAAGSESLDDVLKRDLARAISQKLDNEVINGSGVAGDVTGIANLASVLTPFTFGTVGWTSYMGAQQSLETNFIDSSSAAWLIGPSSANKARTILKSTSSAHFILDGDGCINDIPAYVSSFAGVSEQAILGDWSQVIIAIWGGGYDFVVDFFSLASSGECLITSALYYNVYVRRPQAMIVSTNAGNTYTS